MAYARSVWDCSLAPLFVGSRKGAGGAAASQQFRLALALNCALDEKGRCARPSCVRKIGRNHFREHVLKSSLDSITGMGFLSSFIGPYYSHIDSSMPPPLLFGCDARLPALPRLHVRSIPGRSIDPSRPHSTERPCASAVLRLFGCNLNRALVLDVPRALWPPHPPWADGHSHDGQSYFV